MTPTEFLTGWAALLVIFVLIISRIPRASDQECPPHVWDYDDGLECLRCGCRPHTDDPHFD